MNQSDHKPYWKCSSLTSYISRSSTKGSGMDEDWFMADRHLTPDSNSLNWGISGLVRGEWISIYEIPRQWKHHHQAHSQPPLYGNRLTLGEVEPTTGGVRTSSPKISVIDQAKMLGFSLNLHLHIWSLRRGGTNITTFR